LKKKKCHRFADDSQTTPSPCFKRSSGVAEVVEVVAVDQAGTEEVRSRSGVAWPRKGWRKRLDSLARNMSRHRRHYPNSGKRRRDLYGILTTFENEVR
jgi:hypothetical protein